jgi:hypothetical protein
VFCPDVEIALDQRRRFDSNAALSPSLCAITVDEHSIDVNQECGEESRLPLAEFVQLFLVGSKNTPLLVNVEWKFTVPSRASSVPLNLSGAMRIFIVA